MPDDVVSHVLKIAAASARYAAVVYGLERVFGKTAAYADPMLDPIPAGVATPPPKPPVTPPATPPITPTIQSEYTSTDKGPPGKIPGTVDTVPDAPPPVIATEPASRFEQFNELFREHGGKANTLDLVYNSPFGKMLRQEMAKNGVDPTPQQVMQAAYQYNQDHVLRGGNPSLQDLGSVLSNAFTAQSTPGLEYLTKDKMAPLLEQVGGKLREQGSENWTPEQWENWNRMIARGTRSRVPIPYTGGAINVEGYVPDASQLLDKVSPAVAEKVVGSWKAADEAIKKNPEFGFANWAKSNLMQWLVPAGVVLMLTGNKPLKLVGLLATMVGGYNLYDRYSALMNPKHKKYDEVQAAIKESTFYTNPETGKPDPYGNLDEYKDPTVRQALIDFGTAYRMGFAGTIARKMIGQGQQVAESVFGPESMNAAIQNYLSQNKIQLPEEGTWKAVSDNIGSAARGLWDKGKKLISGEGDQK